MSDDRGVATLPPLATGAGEGARGVPRLRAVRIHAHAAARRHEPDGHAGDRRPAGRGGRQRHQRARSTTAAATRRRRRSSSRRSTRCPTIPDELAEVLQQMTGGSGATFQVNGFRGGRLPTRDEIRQIRFRTNSFSADNHDAGRTQIEIITRPNVREWSGNANMGLRSDVLNARNAVAPNPRRPSSSAASTCRFRGPIVAGKTSMRFGVDGNRAVRFADDLRAERGRDRVSRYRAPAQRGHQLHRGHRARADATTRRCASSTAVTRTPPRTRAWAISPTRSAPSSGAATSTRRGSSSRG